MPRYRAVTFDFGDTLAPGGGRVSVPERVRRTWSERFAREAQVAFPDDPQLFALHQECSTSSGWPLKPGWVEQYEEYYTLWAGKLLDALNVPQAELLAPRFAQAYRDISDRLRVAYDDTHATLERLRALGLRMAIVSNNDGTLARRCGYLKLDHFFECIADSAHVKSNKPDAGIFNHALEVLKIPPQEILHVGDLYGPDVEGAGALGFNTCWINRRGETAPPAAQYKPNYIIRELAELPGLV